MPQRSVLSPSRLKSPAASSAFEMFSETRLNLYVPASGAVQVAAPVTGNVGPVTEVIMARPDPSLSRSGGVPGAGDGGRTRGAGSLRLGPGQGDRLVEVDGDDGRGLRDRVDASCGNRGADVVVALAHGGREAAGGCDGRRHGLRRALGRREHHRHPLVPLGAGLREEGTVVRTELVLLVLGLQPAGLGFRGRRWFGGGCRADGARGERGGRERGEGHARASGKGWCHRGSCRNKGWWPAGRRGAASVDHAERADPEPRTHPRPNFYLEQASALPRPSQTCRAVPAS